ncbi:hypothetical protein [Streptomyces sp. NPDC051001]|uniref:hypothetical protein n=1 Tax=Streptomyces sp. NPDC051001 TaxID=3155795 RepID=UPI0034417449
MCGTGGLRYLDADPFGAHGIRVLPFHTPMNDPLWLRARRVSSLWALSATGPGTWRTNSLPSARHTPFESARDGRGIPRPCPAVSWRARATLRRPSGELPHRCGEQSTRGLVVGCRSPGIGGW